MTRKTETNRLIGAILAGGILLTAGACDKKRKANDAPQKARTTDKQVEKAEPAPQTYLVWWAKGAGGPTTAWVQASGKGFEMGETRPGAVLATDEHLWRWRTETREEQLFACACVEGEAEGKDAGGMPSAEALADTCGKRQRIEVRTQSLEQLSGGDSLSESLESIEQTVGNYVREVRLRGSLGPHLFVSTCVERHRCKPGGEAKCHFDVWDVASMTRRSLSEVLDEGLRTRLNEELAPKAAGILSRRLASYGKEKAAEEGEELSAEDLQVTMAWPEWTEEGLRFSYQFTAPVEQGQGDANWSGGTASVRLSSEIVPELPGVEAPETLPEGVAGAIEGRDARRFGYTELPSAPEVWERLEAGYQEMERP